MSRVVDRWRTICFHDHIKEHVLNQANPIGFRCPFCHQAHMFKKEIELKIGRGDTEFPVKLLCNNLDKSFQFQFNDQHRRWGVDLILDEQEPVDVARYYRCERSPCLLSNFEDNVDVYFVTYGEYKGGLTEYGWHIRNSKLTNEPTVFGFIYPPYYYWNLEVLFDKHRELDQKSRDQHINKYHVYAEYQFKHNSPVNILISYDEKNEKFSVEDMGSSSQENGCTQIPYPFYEGSLIQDVNGLYWRVTSVSDPNTLVEPPPM